MRRLLGPVPPREREADVGYHGLTVSRTSTATEARWDPLPALVAMVAALLGACLYLAGGPAALPAALPLVVLLAFLLTGIYPGEGTLLELISRARRPAPKDAFRRPARRPAVQSSFDPLLLLAASRPLRAPPAARA